MIKRTCLLIDDDKQDDIFPTIAEEGKKYDLEIKCLQFNVGNQERRDLLTKEEIDLDKVVSVFRNEFRGINIDLIAVDWNLSSARINGPILINRFNESSLRVRTPKLLYSGVLKDEIEKIINNYREDNTILFRDIWLHINAIISCNITTFVTREEYEYGIVEQLRRIDDTIETSIEDELRKFPDLKFQTSFIRKFFKGKSFGEIAEILDKDVKLKNEFTKEITEQTIAYLSESFK